MFNRLRQLFAAKPQHVIDHPVLGRLTLLQGAKGPYWLAEAYGDGELTVSVDTLGEAPPSAAQVAFFTWVSGSIEAIYQTVAPALASRHQAMQRQPVAADWHQTFRLAGIAIPLEGDKRRPWEITFECHTGDSGYLYTCHFEDGLLAHITVDT